MICHFVEVMYFRFFVGDDDYCRTIQVAAEAEYGAPILAVSNIIAYPDSDISFDTVLLGDSFDYADAVIWVCPNANEFYDRGTYAVAVTAGTPTSFVLEVKVSPQTLPIPEPPVRINCSDVPKKQYFLGSQSICTEDGITTDVFMVIILVSRLNLTFLSKLFQNKLFSSYDFILPVPPGCHSVSVSLTTMTFSPDAQFQLYCLGVNDFVPVNKLVARFLFLSIDLTFFHSFKFISA
jgi:hypothetical protein